MRAAYLLGPSFFLLLCIINKSIHFDANAGLITPPETQEPLAEEPSAPINKEPSAPINKEPSAAINKEPSAAINKEPSAKLHKEPSAKLHKEPSAELYKEPSASIDIKSFQLSTRCPAGFELRDGSACKLRSLYQLYDSVQNSGVGGTRTGLPTFRDGFSPQQIDLGRYLFFDPLLSGNGDVSCASCHQPKLAFTDGRAVSVGANELKGTRSAPSLWNIAFAERLFWDARADSLEQQALGPLYSANEMANSPTQLLNSLRENAAYPRLFKQAFPHSERLELAQVYTALAAFQTSLVSLNSRYDEYAHGRHDALNKQEIVGLNVFRSFVARCSECHTPPLFTNQQVAVIGTPDPEGMPFDVGAQTTFEAAKLRGGFKVPSLRNIELTAPYMHSGRFASLKEAARFYTQGRGHAVPKGENLHIHWHIWEPNLQDHELDAIVAFLGTLNDQKWMPAVPDSLPSGLPSVHENGKVH